MAEIDASNPQITGDESEMKRMADDDPGMSVFAVIWRTLKLVDGLWGKTKAVGVILLRILP